MKKLHVLMVGSIPFAAYADPRQAIAERDGKSKELTGPPTEIVMVPLVGSSLLAETLDAPKKETSSEMSSLAATFLNDYPPDTEVASIEKERVGSILALARRFAACVMAQDETPGQK